jgi:hypothetical protein
VPEDFITDPKPGRKYQHRLYPLAPEEKCPGRPGEGTVRLEYPATTSQNEPRPGAEKPVLVMPDLGPLRERRMTVRQDPSCRCTAVEARWTQPSGRMAREYHVTDHVLALMEPAACAPWFARVAEMFAGAVLASELRAALAPFLPATVLAALHTPEVETWMDGYDRGAAAAAALRVG